MKHSQKRIFMDIEKMTSDEFKAFCLDIAMEENYEITAESIIEDLEDKLDVEQLKNEIYESVLLSLMEGGNVNEDEIVERYLTEINNYISFY